MRIALHTRLLPGVEKDYENAHREVPETLTDAIRAAGVSDWTIWRDGLDLFHLLECDDYARLIGELADLPVNKAWQTRIATMMEVAHDYSENADQELPAIWDLNP
jgi:L-rhamnose mutarotase